jgi:hypothetical protein
VIKTENVACRKFSISLLSWPSFSHNGGVEGGWKYIEVLPPATVDILAGSPPPLRGINKAQKKSREDITHSDHNISM